MDKRTCYLVEFAEVRWTFSEMGSIGEHKWEYWTAKVLSIRLRSIKYAVYSARFTVVENPDIPFIEETD